MIYPAILAIVAAGAVTVILTFVMPTFIQMFDENGVELPWLTRALLATSDFMTSQYLLIITTLFLAVFGYRMYAKTDHGKYTLSQMKLSIPILKPLNQKMIVSRFTRTLSTSYYQVESHLPNQFTLYQKLSKIRSPNKRCNRFVKNSLKEKD